MIKDGLISDVLNILKGKRFMLHDEKQLQVEIEKVFRDKIATEYIEREFHLNGKDIIDFRLYGMIGVEIKIKGQKREIYRQCCRYCDSPQINALILVTNQSMGFPQEINGKNCYVLNLGKAWL